MNVFDLEFWEKNQRPLGVTAIIIGVGAWVLELTGGVYVCPYCRVQRTVIAILGVYMLFPYARHWIAKYTAFCIGFLGAVVAVNQNFLGWSRISKGEFTIGEQWYLNPFLLSGAAIFIIIAQLWLITMSKADKPRQSLDSQPGTN
jgi:disulfide bond formation protein DsbB